MPRSRPSAADRAVYRMTQEAITNAIRHAGAGRCNVRLAADECLEVCVVVSLL